MIEKEEAAYHIASRHTISPAPTMLLAEEGAYDLLVKDERPKQSQHQNKSNNLRQSISVVAVAVLLFTCLLTVCAFINDAESRRKAEAPGFPEPPESYNCGSSPSTARARNCSFDIMSFSWLPAPCYDGALTDEFLSRSDWSWWRYADQMNEERETVPQSVVGIGEHDSLFVVWEYHLQHCLFMWQKLHRALSPDGGYVDTYISNLNHTMHCQKMLMLRGVELSEVNTMIRIKYPDCVRIGTNGTR